MTAELYQREWAVEVIPTTGQARRFEGFAFRFDVRQGGSSPSSRAEVKNPPRELVGLLQSQGAVVRLLAGYQRDGGAVEVAQGGVLPRSIVQVRTAPTTSVEWQLSAARGPVLTTTLGRLLGGQVSTLDVIEAVLADTGLARDVIDPGEPITYQRGYTLEGSVASTLDTVCRESGSEWSLQDGRLRVYPRGGFASRSADVWSLQTGTIDVAGPADDRLVRATAQLRPSLRRGDLITLDHPNYSGDVAVVEISHSGDSHGQAWTTSIIGRPHA